MLEELLIPDELLLPENEENATFLNIEIRKSIPKPHIKKKVPQRTFPILLINQE